MAIMRRVSPPAGQPASPPSREIAAGNYGRNRVCAPIPGDTGGGTIEVSTRGGNSMKPIFLATEQSEAAVK